MDLIQAIVVAANDPDQQPWIDRIKEAIDDTDPDKLMIRRPKVPHHRCEAGTSFDLTKVVNDATEDGGNVA